MKGRWKRENTRFIYDIMAYSESKNIPGLLVLIGFEKAFDSISWQLISKVLIIFWFWKKHNNLGEIILQISKASILQFGYLSEQFEVQRGCRQGDPIANYLYLLYVEIQAMLIKQNVYIKGIAINSKQDKIIQYADDTSLILDGSLDSPLNSLETIIFFFKFFWTENKQLKNQNGLDRLKTKSIITLDGGLAGVVQLLIY